MTLLSTPAPLAVHANTRPVRIFLVFAFAYFFSAALRAVTATLAPVFSSELGLGPADLGLLAGAFFFGFAALQLPLGYALDRYGPRRSLLFLLALAILGCAAFARASGLAELVAARLLIGMGVGACLMAPLTLFRRVYSPAMQLRANAWMLMTGSLGMLASTLPVQWLLPHWGWRGLFWAAAGLLLLAWVLIAALAPSDQPGPRPRRGNGPGGGGYRQIMGQPIFLRMAPLGFVLYGGLVAVQTLWAGPWLTRVAGLSAAQAAQGLFVINLAMLLAFFAWGAWMPAIARRGISAVHLITWGLPASLVLLFVNVALGASAGPWHWAAWCVACTFVSVSQPAVAQAFAAAQVGRALSAFNLVIFGGVFSLQWGMGVVIQSLSRRGWSDLQAFQLTFALFGVCATAAYVWFLWARPEAADNPEQV
jgi:predicted MFS family arabinose efflux permease